MYAIVTIAGQQFKVEKNQRLFVHRLPDDVGTVMEFDKVVLIDDGSKVKLGNPYIDKALVSAKIVSHVKGDKVLVFKKKRRKGYRKLNGHRQYLTEIIVEEILENVAARKATPVTKKEKKEEPAKAGPVAEKASAAEGAVVKEKPVKAENPAEKKAEKAEPKAKEVVTKTAKSETAAKAGGEKAGKSKPKAQTETGKVKKAEPKAKAEAGKTKKAEPKAKAAAGKAKKAEPKAQPVQKKSVDKKK